MEYRIKNVNNGQLNDQQQLKTSLVNVKFEYQE